MSDDPTSDTPSTSPTCAGASRRVSVDEVMALVMDGRLRGMRVGAPARWRIDAASVSAYLDDQAEEARRMALWRQSQTASFPELWGTGFVRSSD